MTHEVLIRIYITLSVSSFFCRVDNIRFQATFKMNLYLYTLYANDETVVNESTTDL